MYSNKLLIQLVYFSFQICIVKMKLIKLEIYFFSGYNLSNYMKIMKLMSNHQSIYRYKLLLLNYKKKHLWLIPILSKILNSNRISRASLLYRLKSYYLLFKLMELKDYYFNEMIFWES